MTDVGSCNTLNKKTHSINMATERTLQQDDNNRSILTTSSVNVCHVRVGLSFAHSLILWHPRTHHDFKHIYRTFFLSFFLRTSSLTVIETLRQSVIRFMVFWLDTMLAIILVFSEWSRNCRRLYICRSAHLLSPMSRPLKTAEWIWFLVD